MVSMMKVWKDLLEFVMLERAAATISQLDKGLDFHVL